MEKSTPENNREQTEKNEIILPQIAITESNISSTVVTSSINKSNDNNVRPEMDAEAENNPSESKPIVLHPSVQNFEEKGAIPKRDVGESLHKRGIRFYHKLKQPFDITNTISYNSVKDS